MTTFHTEKKSNISQGIALEAIVLSKRYALKSKARSGSAEESILSLQDISFSLSKGEVLGVIGRNGAGKSTLLNILSGTVTPTRGEVKSSGKVLGLFNLGVGFQDELTGRENIFLNGAIVGASKAELDSKLRSIIEFSELGEFIEMPLGTYSQGMRLRLGFSIIANLDFDILLIDEVLAVGDALFQSKCFERLMDFKRKGKSLVITSQDMNLIERLCDRALLLDHGKMILLGDVNNAVNRYRALLGSEKFSLGPLHKESKLFESTKWWADNASDWNQRLGTKEAEIKSVKFFNRFGLPANKVKSGSFFRVRVEFEAKDTIRDPHFGVAIFREDGVYCYGPNTDFDGIEIRQINPGKGYFEATFTNLILAPGSYRLSVAIWDKHEALAFDYHNGVYKFEVCGVAALGSELINAKYRIREINHSLPEAVSMIDCTGIKKGTFFTNQRVNILLNGESLGKIMIMRDDGICCQSIALPQRNSQGLVVVFKEFPFLPGGYQVASGKDALKFRMVFSKEDHGTVYLNHKWKWRLP